MRKFRDDKLDPNDNGLRVPRRVVEAEGGKKKKKIMIINLKVDKI